MNRKRFLLFAAASSAVFFLALAGLLLLVDHEEATSPSRTEYLSFSQMTQAQKDSIQGLRLETSAAASVKFKAFVEKHGVEGLADAILEIAARGDEILILESKEGDSTIIDSFDVQSVE